MEKVKAKMHDVLFFNGMGFYLLVKMGEQCSLINLKTGAEKCGPWTVLKGKDIVIPESTLKYGGPPINYGRMTAFTVMEEKEELVTVKKKVKRAREVVVATCLDY